VLVGGKYRIEKLLGRGGMGAVYLARHELLDTHVALKVLAQESVGNEDATRRLIKEARLAAKIPGDHICRVTDVGVGDNGVPYIAMEHLEGRDLSAVLQARGPLPVAEAAGYVLQALDAIAHAHARGIVHRDLKPSNLFVATGLDGRPLVKVLDFGISKSMGPADLVLTATSALLGSPAYMSPEQVRSAKNVDARTDIWSMGVILYELLTGRMPYPGESVGEVFASILETDAPSVLASRTDLPPALAAAVARCLQRRADQRFGNAAEVADAIAPFALPGEASLADTIRSTLSKAGMTGPRAQHPASPSSADITGAGPAQVLTANAWADTLRADAAPSPSRPQRWILIGAVSFGMVTLAVGVASVARGLASGDHAAAPASVVATADRSVPTAPAATPSVSAGVSPAPSAPSASAVASAVPAATPTAAVTSTSALPPRAPPAAPRRPATPASTSALSPDRH
jgi:eukaryotic-like serine/threonine-protein kinase